MKTRGQRNAVYHLILIWHINGVKFVLDSVHNFFDAAEDYNKENVQWFHARNTRVAKEAWLTANLISASELEQIQGLTSDEREELLTQARIINGTSMISMNLVVLYKIDKRAFDEFVSTGRISGLTITDVIRDPSNFWSTLRNTSSNAWDLVFNDEAPMVLTADQLYKFVDSMANDMSGLINSQERGANVSFTYDNAIGGNNDA